MDIQHLPLKFVGSGREVVKILPEEYYFCDVEDLVALIANMLSEVIQINDQHPTRNDSPTRFHSRAPPSIPVVEYLHRIARYASLTPALLPSIVSYMDQLCSLYPEFAVSSLTVHRFLITAATVASKGLSDGHWPNWIYAYIGGVGNAELGMLEREFLRRVDWKILPDPHKLVGYYQALIARAGTHRMETGSTVETN